jgi:anti-sigma regulatory factor (Ser/Thr protein kinase)
MHTDTPGPPEKITFERDYPGEASQARRVRADLAQVAGECPVADDLILLASELAANATTHSRSGKPGGRFTVRANLYPGDYAWVEVIDQGGPWTPPAPGDEHGRGLAIVEAIAGDGNWGIDGDAACHVVWFRLNWHQDQGQAS